VTKIATLKDDNHCHPTIIVTFAQIASNAFLHIRITKKKFLNALIKK
jgi:hypothetical protein